MKTILLFTGFIAIMGLAAYAQDNGQGWKDTPENRFYARLGAGGGIGLCYYDPCDEFDEDYGPEADVLKSVNFAPGKGFDIELAAGYRPNRYLALELAIRDHLGLKTKTNVNYEGEGSYIKNSDIRAMIISVTPSFVITPGLANFNPYARFGMGIGIVPDLYYKEVTTSGGNVYSIEGKYHGGIPLGYSIAGGMDFRIGNSLKLFGEFNCIGMNYTPKYYDVTKYTVNGADHLGDLSEKQKRTEFVKTYDKEANIPNDSPNKQLKQTFPVSSFGLNVGITYNIGK